ncbi:MAG: aminopeptidase [Bacteroidales bacterium]|nr:aminopeptidase [Bacteroidales bacterium]
MKKFLIILTVALAGTVAFGQQRPPQVKLPEYQFTVVKANPITSVKNQNSSGTCWAYSTIGFFESEAIRLGKISDPANYPDFSEFFVVSHSYYERALKYVRMDGKLGFSAGSEADDVLDVIRDHGIVPNAAMTGMNYGTELPVQGELDAVLKGIVDAIVKNPNRTLTTAWPRAFQAVLDEYLGKCPETFVVDGKEYTPLSYRDALKINPADYVTLTSFTHHPFYTKFVIEVCDNWRGDEAYNVPIDEFMSVLDNALNNGYTVAWGADVSHPGFTRDGVAVYADTKAIAAAGSDQEHWVGKEEGKPAPVIVIEKEATQELRQFEFDNKTLTDDHGMQIYGIAKDQDGKKYYMVKNSWGETGKYKGIWYATEAFVKGQSLDYMIHKDALPKDLKAKLGIK